MPISPSSWASTGGHKAYFVCASLSFSTQPPPFVLFLPSPSSASAALLSFCRTRSAFALHSALPGARGQYTYHAKFAAAWWLQEKKETNLLPTILTTVTKPHVRHSRQQRAAKELSHACLPSKGSILLVLFLFLPAYSATLLLQCRVLCLSHPPKAVTGVKWKRGEEQGRIRKKKKESSGEIMISSFSSPDCIQVKIKDSWLNPSFLLPWVERNST